MGEAFESQFYEYFAGTQAGGDEALCFIESVCDEPSGGSGTELIHKVSAKGGEASSSGGGELFQWDVAVEVLLHEFPQVDFMRMVEGGEPVVYLFVEGDEDVYAFLYLHLEKYPFGPEAESHAVFQQEGEAV